MMTLIEVNSMIENELSRVNKLIKLTSNAKKLNETANNYIEQLILLKQMISTSNSILDKCNNSLKQLGKEPNINALNIISSIEHGITYLLVNLDHMLNSVKPSNTSKRYLKIYKAFIDAYHYEADEIFTKTRSLMYKCTYYSYEQDKKKNNTLKI